MDDELHDLGHIQVDPQRRPLGLDRMLERARFWKHSAPSAPIRPPSPPPGEVPLALPAPLAVGAGDVSPLAGMFQYPELVPLVLDELRRPGELATAARVCVQWNEIARKRLYADIWVRPWEEAPKARLVGLFKTLEVNPHLCAIVRKLDIRFYPMDIRGDDQFELGDAVLRSISNMKNLERLVWTRDRSITAELFSAITSLPRLRYLELTGHCNNRFDPRLLSGMPVLRDLRVMMPDTTFRLALPTVIRALHERPDGGLHGLALVCKSFNIITNQVLTESSEYLPDLRRLMLIGAARVTRTGVYTLLRQTERLEELVLDAPPHSDLLDLSDIPPLDFLQTFSLSFPAPNARESLEPEDMPRLRQTDSLRALELNMSSDPRASHRRQRLLPLPAFTFLMEQIDFTQLTRLALLNLVIDREVLAAVIAATPALQELYITVTTHRTMVPELFDGLPLRVLHAMVPEQMGPTRDDLVVLASMMPKLEQIGHLNRVYEVHRRYFGDEHRVELVRWRQVTLPGYFQVWRA